MSFKNEVKNGEEVGLEKNEVLPQLQTEPHHLDKAETTTLWFPNQRSPRSTTES